MRGSAAGVARLPMLRRGLKQVPWTYRISPSRPLCTSLTASWMAGLERMCVPAWAMRRYLRAARTTCRLPRCCARRAFQGTHPCLPASTRRQSAHGCDSGWQSPRHRCLSHRASGGRSANVAISCPNRFSNSSALVRSIFWSTSQRATTFLPKLRMRSRPRPRTPITARRTRSFAHERPTRCEPGSPRKPPLRPSVCKTVVEISSFRCALGPRDGVAVGVGKMNGSRPKTQTFRPRFPSETVRCKAVDSNAPSVKLHRPSHKVVFLPRLEGRPG